MTVKIHIQRIHDANTDQRQDTGIDKGRPDTADHKIIRNQKIRFPNDLHNSMKNLIYRLHEQSGYNKINREQGQNQKAFVF